MFERQTTGSVVCSACGTLVGVQDERCYNCGRRNPGLWGYAPLVRRLGGDLGFVPLVLTSCVALYVVSLLLSGTRIRVAGGLSFLSPSLESLFLLGASGALPVFRFDRWWTVLSAAWLHGGLLHILFNMLWVRQLAPAVAETYGPGRLMILYVASGATGFIASTLAGEALADMPIAILRGGQFTVGASAPIFGLLGALVYYGRRSGSSMAHREALGYAVMLGIFGLLFPGIDNYAHAGGFAGGYFLGRFLDPLQPERIDHLAIGLGCLVLSGLAIAASVIHGVGLFM